MENEFWIDVEILSLGGRISLMIIPRRRHFEVILDEQEIGRIYCDRSENWMDMDGSLPPGANSLIGHAIEEFKEGFNSFKIAG